LVEGKLKGRPSKEMAFRNSGGMVGGTWKGSWRRVTKEVNVGETTKGYRAERKGGGKVLIDNGNLVSVEKGGNNTLRLGDGLKTQKKVTLENTSSAAWWGKSSRAR